MRGLLTTASVMMCPHGGTVQATSANTRVQAAARSMLRSVRHVRRSPAARSTSAGAPHPCVRCKWVVSRPRRSQVVGDFDADRGERRAVPSPPTRRVQGPVLIVATQTVRCSGDE